LSTPANPVASAPVTVSLAGGTAAEILLILQTSLNVLSAIPATSAGAALANVILQIIAQAVGRIQSQTGKPIDLTTIPIEAPLP
jgi:hypothetical protein